MNGYECQSKGSKKEMDVQSASPNRITKDRKRKKKEDLSF
jgi:hypothetical protein